MNNYTGQGNPGRTNRQTQDEGPGWGEILGGVAAVGVGIYALTKIFGESSTEENSEVGRRRELQQGSRSGQTDRQTVGGSPRFPSATTAESDFSRMNTIVVAVDATPDKCGGLIRMIGDKIVYYYSAPWKPYYSFSKINGEPDKFEMVNALVALTAFEGIILKNIRRSSGSLTIKVDSYFHKSSYKNEHKELRDHIERKKDRFSGNWEQCTKHDHDMNSADKLSRRIEYEAIMYERYPGYTLSEVDVGTTMKNIKHIVPAEHHYYQPY